MENTLLNLIPAAYLPEIHLSQYDIGRTLTFTLKDGASDYSVPSGASVKVKATKPSGFGFEVACTFNGGTVTLVTTETMTLENGRFPAELSIVSGNTTIGTSNFIFNIERSPHPEGTTDGDAETIIPELTLLVERIEAAAEDVDEKSELFLNLSAEAETLPAGSPATASYSNGVLTLGIPRGYDGDDTKADAIVKSASGEVASFTDGGNGLLVKSLIANITPKQSGSGDPSPSNVRPISGYSEVKTTRCGKNILKNTLTSTTQNGTTFTKNADGSVTVSGTPSAKATVLLSGGDFLVQTLPTVFSYGVPMPTGTRLYCKATSTSGTVSYPTISSNSVPYVILSTSGATLNNLVIEINTLFNGTPFTIYPMIELGSTPTSYEPYNGTTYTTSLGQTVYGGTLEVMSGKLTISYAYKDLGSMSWAKAWGQNTIFTTTLADGKYGTNLFCSNYVTLTQGSLADKDNALFFKNTYYGDHALAIRDDRYTDATAFKTAMNGVQLVYELATPTEITLTPTQVTTLLGNNNIWADSGSVEVEYRADTTLAYNELLSLIASLS